MFENLSNRPSFPLPKVVELLVINDGSDFQKNNKKNKSLKVAELSRAKKSFTFKGSSSSNPAKGKSLATFEGDEIPLAIRIAQEVIFKYNK